MSKYSSNYNYNDDNNSCDDYNYGDDSNYSGNNTYEKIQRSRYLQQNLEFLQHHPAIFKLLSEQNDLPSLELVLTDLKIYRHDTDKDVLLVATPFNLYLLKIKFPSEVISTLTGASSSKKLYRNSVIKPYCRWGLHAIEVEVDPRDNSRIVIWSLDEPMNDEGEFVYVDLSDPDEQKALASGFEIFDPDSGYYSQSDSDGSDDDSYGLSDTDTDNSSQGDSSSNKKQQKSKKNKQQSDSTVAVVATKSEAELKKELQLKKSKPWKTVVLQTESFTTADWIVTELQNRSVSSVVLRQKWSRNRLDTLISSNRKNNKLSGSSSSARTNQKLALFSSAFLQQQQNLNSQSQNQEEDFQNDYYGDDESDSGDDVDNNSSSSSISESNNNQFSSPARSTTLGRKTMLATRQGTTIEEQKRKREANRRRNKTAQEEITKLFPSSSSGVGGESSGGVVTADTLKLNAEMRKVSALMTAEGLSDVKLLKEVMNSRIAAAAAAAASSHSENQSQQQQQNNSTTTITNKTNPIIDPLQLLRQQVHDNETAMELVFSHHYEKFLTFTDKTAMLAAETVEHVQHSHDAVGSAVDANSGDLKHAASVVVESRQVLDRVGLACQMLKKRVAVSRMLENCERCVSEQNVVGLAELLHPLYDLTTSNLPSNDTLLFYVKSIRLPQLRSIATDLATKKLNSWLGSLRDCIVPLGEDLWRRAVDHNNFSKIGKAAQMNRISERVEHVRKRLVLLENNGSSSSQNNRNKNSKPHSWRIDQVVVPVDYSDIASSFFRKQNINNNNIGETNENINEELKTTAEIIRTGKTFFQQQQQQKTKEEDSHSHSHSHHLSVAERLMAARRSSSSTSTTEKSQQQKHADPTTTGSPTTTTSTTTISQINDNIYSNPEDYRGASYGRTLRQLFHLLGLENQLLAECFQTRRIHLGALIQSILSNTSDYSSKSFIFDCTRALGFLHCEELLAHESNLDFTTTHLLYVWEELQKALAKRATTIGHHNKPSCAALFRILTHFRTAALGCLLFTLPDCEVLDKVRREQRDHMQTKMFSEITMMLEQLLLMDSLDTPTSCRDRESFKLVVLQYNLQRGGTNMLPPISSSVFDDNSNDNDINNSVPAQSSSITSRFSRLHHHHRRSDSKGGGGDSIISSSSLPPRSPSISLGRTTSTSQNQNNNNTNNQIKITIPITGIVSAAGSAILGFLNECFSLGYDSGIDGGAVGANSDEAHENQGNRIIDDETGLMVEILDGSSHREWSDNTTLSMAELIFTKLAAEFRVCQAALVEKQELRKMALLRNNAVACRLVASTVEQRYALLFHGSVSGNFQMGTEPVFFDRAIPDFTRLGDEIEQQFSVSFLDVIATKLQPIGKLSYWQNLLQETKSHLEKELVESSSTASSSSQQKTTTVDAETSSSKEQIWKSLTSELKENGSSSSSSSSTQLKNLPTFALENSIVYQVLNNEILSLLEYLLTGMNQLFILQQQQEQENSFNNNNSNNNNSKSCLVWPENLIVAQARSAVCRVADCIKDNLDRLVEKCEVRKAGDLLECLPLISSCIQESVDYFMEKINFALPWNFSQNEHFGATGTGATPSASSSYSASASSLRSRLSASSSSSSSHQPQHRHQQQEKLIATFPIENLDKNYFVKLREILLYNAEEYKHVSTKLGANLELAAGVAWKGATSALKGVEKLGSATARGFLSVGGTVVSVGKKSLDAVTDAAGAVTNEVVDSLQTMKEEMEQTEDVDEKKFEFFESKNFNSKKNKRSFFEG